MAELERVSGVRRSTIHHYVNLGLLPQPRVAGPKLHLFDPDHVARLREIKRLRELGEPLSRIGEQLVRFSAPAPAPRRTDGGEASESTSAPDALRERIVRAATALFAERGYEAVRLLDVARALGIGKATIYRYFDGKQALFVDCVEHVRLVLIPKAARDATDRQQNAFVQARQRASGVLRHFTAYRTLTQLLGSLAQGRDPRLARKARVELHDMISNAEPLLRKLIDAKQIRGQDSELLSYMLWGALMGAGERMSQDDRYTLPKVLDAFMDFVAFGVAGRSA